jgi:FG-GAP repeat protein
MRCNHFKRTLTVWACTGGIALLSGSAALAELPGHPVVQTLEATHEEVQPDPEEPPQQLYFGWAVAIRDGTAFVGMPDAFGRGRVAIFSQTASGWQRSGTLTPPENVPAGDFGQSLTFRDGYAMVGSTAAVYVYKRVNGQWSLSQRVARPAGETAADFANAMHFENGILVVGAPQANSNRAGTAYVYERNAAGSFVLRSTLKPADGHSDDWFGWDVAVAGGVIVIGAPRSGAAYVFRRSSTGAWVQRQRLESGDAQTGEPGSFGWAVAIDKSMIVVGAPNVDIEGVPGFPQTADGHIAGGAVYGFVPVSGTFVGTFKLRPRPDENPEYLSFGNDVAMFDKRVVVSATHDGFGVKAGYVHTYRRDGSNVTALGLADGGFAEAEYNSLGLANQWLLVGSPYSFGCNSSGPCIGNATVIDLSKFTQ